MLTLPEEVVLLVLDEESGALLPIPQRTLDSALAGGALMELALQDRVDSDLESLWVVDPTPVGEPYLDDLLRQLSESKGKHDPETWIQRLSEDSGSIQEAALRRLVERGVLREEEKRFLWVFESRRYPMIDGKEEREVKLRIMGVLFSEEIPDPRDVALISLVDACRLFEEILGPRELERVRDRIAVIRKLDLIGQAMQAKIREIERIVTHMLPVLH